MAHQLADKRIYLCRSQTLVREKLSFSRYGLVDNLRRAQECPSLREQQVSVLLGVRDNVFSFFASIGNNVLRCLGTVVGVVGAFEVVICHGVEVKLRNAVTAQCGVVIS